MKGRKVFWYDFRSGVRTSREDVLTLARTVAAKLNQAKGPSTFIIPLKGWSEADSPDGPLHEPETNDLFIREIKSLLDGRIQIKEVDAHINDEEFDKFVVSEMDTMMRNAGKGAA